SLVASRVCEHLRCSTRTTRTKAETFKLGADGDLQRRFKREEARLASAVGVSVVVGKGNDTTFNPRAEDRFWQSGHAGNFARPIGSGHLGPPIGARMSRTVAISGEKRGDPHHAGR